MTVFTRISAAALIKFFAPQVRRLFEGGACLKVGRYKEIFPSNFAVYFSFVSSFNSDPPLPFYRNPFFEEKTFSSAGYTEFLELAQHWDRCAYSRAALINFFVPNAALIRGKRFIEDGAYSSKYGIVKILYFSRLT